MNLRFTQLLSLFGLTLAVFLTTPLSAQEASDEDTVYRIVEEMPRFPGCEDIEDMLERRQCADSSLKAFISDNLVYPIGAEIAEIEGTVVVRFIIDKDGTVRAAEIVRDIEECYDCKDEAIRLINLMNEKEIIWIPGKQDGEPVHVQFHLPVKFKLD